MQVKQTIIGSRGSELALWQANHIKSKLLKLGLDPVIKVIKTKGDKFQDLSFDKIEGKGFFTKEIENSLLNKNIDLAVHSLKDLETEQPKGLCIAAVPKREDPADTLLINFKSIDKSKPLEVYTIFFNFQIAWVGFFIKCKSMLKTRAPPACYVNAQT